jgi:uncharacterized membrane protein
MSLRPRLLQAGILTALAGACVAVVLATPSGSPERVIAAFALILVLPGAAITALMTSAEGRGPAERLMLIAALSIAAVILLSAGLYVVGIHLDLHSWTISLGILTALCAGLSLLIPGAPVIPTVSLHGLRAPAVVALVASGALLAGAAIVTAHSVSGRNTRDSFTQLWAKPGGARTATIGIYNHEGGTHTYTVRVSTNRGVLRTAHVTLADQTSWTSPQTVPPRATRLLVTISKSGSSAAVYRWVQLRYPGNGG